jgi:hypothetical protein
MNAAGNHVAAAKALATELGWNYGKWTGGELPNGCGTAFVCESKWNDEGFIVDEISDEAAAAIRRRA